MTDSFAGSGPNRPEHCSSALVRSVRWCWPAVCCSSASASASALALALVGSVRWCWPAVCCSLALALALVGSLRWCWPAVVLACGVLLIGAGPQHAVMLACNLLLAPPSTATLWRRSRLGHRQRMTCIGACRRPPVHWGLPQPEPPTAVALIAADTCERVLDRSIPPRREPHRLSVVGHEGSTLGDLLAAVAALADRLDDDLGGLAANLRTRLDALTRALLHRPAAANPTLTPHCPHARPTSTGSW
jgi:hypothetical protein